MVEEADGDKTYEAVAAPPSLCLEQEDMEEEADTPIGAETDETTSLEIDESPDATTGPKRKRIQRRRGRETTIATTTGNKKKLRRNLPTTQPSAIKPVNARRDKPSET